MAVPFLLGGCVAAGPSPLNYSMRRTPGGGRTDVFDVARSVLADMGYLLARADAADGPDASGVRSVSASHPEEALRTGKRLSSRNRVRRLARVRGAAADETVRVYCKVVIQEQVTEAHLILWQDLMSSDRPVETPIDRGGAATEDQNTVWQTLRRDKAAERRILEAILARAGGGEPGSNQ